MFGRITFKDRLQSMLAQKQRQLIDIRIRSLEIPVLEQQIIEIQQWLDSPPEPAASTKEWH
jgi:hypothetical protein